VYRRRTHIIRVRPSIGFPTAGDPYGFGTGRRIVGGVVGGLQGESDAGLGIRAPVDGITDDEPLRRQTAPLVEIATDTIRPRDGEGAKAIR
jgi:hypothetical protein